MRSDIPLSCRQRAKKSAISFSNNHFHHLMALLPYFLPPPFLSSFFFLWDGFRVAK